MSEVEKDEKVFVVDELIDEDEIVVEVEQDERFHDVVARSSRVRP